MRITSGGSLLIGSTTQAYNPQTQGYLFGVKSNTTQTFISIAKSMSLNFHRAIDECKNFEDSIQILCASKIDKIDCIVTRNTKDFRNSEILVLTPDELCLRW